MVAYGTYSVADETGSIIILDSDTGADAKTLCCHQGNVFALALSPDSARVASVGFADGTLRLWDVADGSNVWLRNDPSGGRFFAVVFSTDGTTIAAGGGDGVVRLFDAASGAETMTLAGHQAPISNLAFTQDGRGLYSSSFDGSTRLWNLGPSQPDVVEFIAHPMEGRPNDEAVVTVAFSPDGELLLTVLGHDEALLWDPVDPVEPIVLAPMCDVFGVIMWGDFAPDGSNVAIGGIEAYPRIFDVESGELLVTLEDPDVGHYRGVSFSPDGSRLLTAHDNKHQDESPVPKIWDLNTGSIIHRLDHEGRVWDVEWSPDGSVVATAGADDTRIWDPETGLQLYSLGDSGVIDMEFSPDGFLLATAGFGEDGSLRIWDVDSGEEVANLEGHGAPVAGVAWSPDGESIVMGSMDNLVKIWDVGRGVETETLTEHPASVWGVAWSIDGTIATVSELGDVRLHRKDLETLERAARQRVTRSLTDAECQNYLGIETCPRE